MKYERINPKTNITNFLPRLFGKIINNVKYTSINFFDTNMIVKKSEEGEDKRIKFIHKMHKVITSNTFNNEVTKLLQTGRYSKIYHDSYAIIDFEQMRSNRPESCPLYYNFVHCMVNPANISSLLFLKERVLSAKIQNPSLSEEELKAEETINKIVSSRIDEGRKNKINIFGEKKDSASEFVDLSVQKYYQKKMKALSENDLGYYNDIKSLALALLFCLQNRCNVHFYTSDCDMVIHFRNWVDSVSHQLSLKHLILQRLIEADRGRERIWGGKEHYIFKISLNTYLDLERGMRVYMMASDWKKSGYFFQIHSWNEKDQKYIDDVKINFNEIIEENLLNLHGPLSCPCVRNNMYANWFCWSYIWPPKQGEKDDVIQLTVIPKVHRNYKTTNCSTEDHKEHCSYAKADSDNNLKVLSGFAWAGTDGEKCNENKN